MCAQQFGLDTKSKLGGYAEFDKKKRQEQTEVLLDFYEQMNVRLEIGQYPEPARDRGGVSFDVYLLSRSRALASRISNIFTRQRTGA